MSFLLIDGSTRESDSQIWVQVLSQSLQPLGTLEIVSERQASERIKAQAYDLIFIDATAVSDVPLLITRLHGWRPNVRIVVVTASPTWTAARGAYRAGAHDYIPKSGDVAVLRAEIQRALSRPVSRSRQYEKAGRL